MRVVFKEPGKGFEIRDISNELEALQNLVGGWIEHVGIKEGLGLIVNEEGKLNFMEPNFYMINEVVLGPAVFVGEEGEEFTDISDESIELLRLFFDAEV